MLIRSQDKTALVKFENIVINLKLPDSLNIICWSLQDAQRSGGYFILGRYSTKEKAMKVLDMIQEAYGDSEYTKYVIPEVCRILSMKPKTEENITHAEELGEMLKKGMTFQMPEDGSVEVKSYKDIGTLKELKELKENGAFTGLELAKLAIMQKELKKYKDLEEQGLLVRFPCPIGTTVWDIYGMGIRKNVVSGIEYGKDGRWFLWANEDEWLGELNVVVFLTREEAENKLEELKNEI